MPTVFTFITSGGQDVEFHIPGQGEKMQLFPALARCNSEISRQESTRFQSVLYLELDCDVKQCRCASHYLLDWSAVSVFCNS